MARKMRIMISLIVFVFSLTVIDSEESAFLADKSERSILTDAPSKRDIDVLRQLLNQETLIRIELEKSVRELVKENNQMKSEKINEGKEFEKYRKDVRKTQESVDSEMIRIKAELKLIKTTCEQEIKTVKEEVKVQQQKIKIAEEEKSALSNEVSTIKLQLKLTNVSMNLETERLHKKLSSLKKNEEDSEITELRRKGESHDETIKILQQAMKQNFTFINSEMNFLKDRLDSFGRTVQQQNVSIDQDIGRLNKTLELLKEDARKINSDVESLKDTFKESNDSVHTRLNELHGDVLQVNVSSSNDKVKNDQLFSTIKTNLTGLLNELVEDKTSTNARLDNVERKHDVLSQRTQQIIKENKSKISFTAVMVKPKTSNYINEGLVFPKVISNQGNGYNSRTGVFTSPVNGTFVFYTSVFNRISGKSMYYQIVMNSAMQVTTYTYDPNSMAEQGSTLVVLHLRVGDRVWVRYSTGTDGIHAQTNLNPTFSGFLL